MHICSNEKKKLQKTNVLSAQPIKKRAKLLLLNSKAENLCVCDAVRHTRNTMRIYRRFILIWMCVSVLLNAERVLYIVDMCANSLDFIRY